MEIRTKDKVKWKVKWPLQSEFSSRPPVVQKLDNAIHRLNHYPVDKY